jgi:hypothetical protein
VLPPRSRFTSAAWQAVTKWTCTHYSRARGLRTRRPFPLSPYSAAEDIEGNESVQHHGAEARAHVCGHLNRARPAALLSFGSAPWCTRLLRAAGECLSGLEVKRGGCADNVAGDAIRAHDRVRGQSAASPAELLAHGERRNDEVDVLRIGRVRGRPQEHAQRRGDCARARGGARKACDGRRVGCARGTGCRGGARAGACG